MTKAFKFDQLEFDIMLNFEDVQERDGQSMLFDEHVNLLNVRYRCSFILECMAFISHRSNQDSRASLGTLYTS